MCVAFIITEVIPHIEVIHTHTAFIFFVHFQVLDDCLLLLEFGVRARNTTTIYWMLYTIILLSFSFQKKRSLSLKQPIQGLKYELVKM